MALVDGNVSITLLDELGVKTPMPTYFQVDDANTIADAVTAALALAGLVDAVTASQELDVTIKLTGIGLPGGAKTAPIAGSRNSNVGNFAFNQAGIVKDYTETVPAIRETLVVNGGINNAAPAISNLTGELVTPGSVLGWASNTWRDLTAWTSSFLSDRKHRKQTITKSRRQP